MSVNDPDDGPRRDQSPADDGTDLLGAVMASTVDGIVVVDEDGRIRQANGAITRMFGYSEAELLGHHLHTLLALEDIEARHLFEDSGSIPKLADLTGRHRTGTPFPVQFRTSEVASGSGMIRLCILRDRSELKLAETNLREMTERFRNRVLELEDDRDRNEQQTANLVQLADELAIARAQAESATERAEEQLTRIDAIVRTVADAIITCDECGRIDSVNPAAERLFGYSHAQLRDNDLGTLISGLDADTLFARADATVSGPGASQDLVPLEWRGLHESGAEIPVEISVGGMHIRGQRMFTCVVRDITKRKETENTIREMALYDPLTGIANRHLFRRDLETALAGAERNEDRMALVLLDLDNFKQVNDHFGHPIGDALLVEVAKLLKSAVRPSDTTARLGGDEFAVILPSLDDAKPVGAIARRIVESLSVPFTINGCLVKTGASIGIAFYPDDETGVEELMRKADLALYQAKSNGRGSFQLYDEAMHTEVRRHKNLLNDLRLGIVREEFEPYFHPQIDLATDRIRGLEALARWHRPGHDLVFPDVFIPVAESSGLIKDLGEAMLRATCRQAKAWQDGGRGPWSVAVNVSVRQIQAGDLAERVRAILQETGLAAEWLELEITESALIGADDTLDSLTQLRDLGIDLTIDDFGTGYASLAQLKRLPVQRLKIDRTFVANLTTNAADAAIVETVIRLARSLDLSVVAEGVEEPAQLSRLRDMGCDEVQGFHYTKPLAAPALVDWAESRRQ
ncbi:MAG: EAL domain-containing protein [Alphaproteobacteria bacterium]|jgi:diguanylate cyclase (GGDEF)-like protein/PAS domain S-box-containing protein|nr:EAL domain-containing protein [Alphaproteobacteria bacterium]